MRERDSGVGIGRAERKRKRKVFDTLRFNRDKLMDRYIYLPAYLPTYTIGMRCFHVEAQAQVVILWSFVHR